MTKECLFSDSKFSNENTTYHNNVVTKFKSMNHSNMIFIVEKSIESSNLLKLKVYRNSITGEVLLMMHNHNLDMRESHNLLCAIRPFRTKVCDRIIHGIMTKSNGASKLHQ